jgi:hypothetical protein
MINRKSAVVAGMMILALPLTSLAESIEDRASKGQQALTQAMAEMPSFILKRKPETKTETKIKTKPQSQIELNDSLTPYEALGKLFKQGTIPSFEDMTGWFAGRCYTSENPTTPIPELLVSENPNQSDDNNNGPLFHNDPVLTFAGYHYADIRSNIENDSINIDQLDAANSKIRIEVKKCLAEDANHRTPLSLKNGTLGAPVGKDGDDRNFYNVFRKSGGNIIEQLAGGGGWHCYYFRRVGPPKLTLKEVEKLRELREAAAMQDWRNRDEHHGYIGGHDPNYIPPAQRSASDWGYFPNDDATGNQNLQPYRHGGGCL